MRGEKKLRENRLLIKTNKKNYSPTINEQTTQFIWLKMVKRTQMRTSWPPDRSG